MTCLGTKYASGHTFIACQGINVSGDKRVWTQTCLGTNVSGYKRVWAQTRLGTIMWAQACMSTNVWYPLLLRGSSENFGIFFIIGPILLKFLQNM